MHPALDCVAPRANMPDMVPRRAFATRAPRRSHRIAGLHLPGSFREHFKSDRLATSDPRNASALFVTRKVEGVWTAPELLPYPISTDAGNEHCPAILNDGETLCFASRREGIFWTHKSNLATGPER